MTLKKKKRSQEESSLRVKQSVPSLMTLHTHTHTHTQEEASLRALWVALVEKGICTQKFLLKCADDLGLVVPGASLTRMQLDGMRMLRLHPNIEEKVLKIDLPEEVIVAQIQVLYVHICMYACMHT